ncbi:patatin-like phospholipase family protein [Pelagibius litoralis]|uniref:Patatin-like phospholipase family protein n=1 Tax=Pelagibius litoralis TaxID=374515 RepID=A0A967C7J4_9PROT|nr:patatin-like phospholipase family protein [Pelagibius litoralis]NIA68022.1 patatin-like phospholipase family protein [Pelagibius litoralis]
MALRDGVSRLDTTPARQLWRSRRRKTATPRLSLSLALQGGGAHGAFTWGVLDRLLEEDRLDIDGLSGASAGALNAAALASGWLEGGRDGARESLDRLWRRVSSLGEFNPPAAASPALDMMTRMFSPYQLNPLGVNPLRAVLEEAIDFEALRAAVAPRLFVSATELKQGRAALFENPDMTADALLASACLPHLYRAVAIDGAHYWDGGFMANPTIFPLVFHCDSRDVLIVQIDSLTTDEVPRSARQIANRRSQIVFNAPLMRELEGLAYMGRMAAAGKARGDSMAARVRGLNLHLLEGGAAMRALDVSSKQRADWGFLQDLKAIGREAAAVWLERHGAALGRRSTVELPGA